MRGRRSELPDGIFHVTTRGVDSCLIYRDEVDRISFLRLFAEVVARFRWRTYAFCLMGTTITSSWRPRATGSPRVYSA